MVRYLVNWDPEEKAEDIKQQKLVMMNYDLACRHVTDRSMSLNRFQLFQAPFQLIQSVHG